MYILAELEQCEGYVNGVIVKVLTITSSFLHAKQLIRITILQFFTDPEMQYEENSHSCGLSLIHIWFFVNMQTLPESEILKQKCLNLQNVLQDEDKLGESDIDGNHLFEELKHLGVYLKKSEIKLLFKLCNLFRKVT